MSSRKATVIGAGVIGQSAVFESLVSAAQTIAIRLAESGYEVTIFARELPPSQSQDYASPWAGAHWSTFATDATPRLKEWEQHTYGVLAKLPHVKATPARHYYPDRDRMLESTWFRSFVPGFKELPADQCPEDLPHGIEYTTLCIDVPEYTAHLTERLSALKVIMRESTIDSFSAILEAIPDTSIIVNATGLGARHLKGVEDAAVYPVRGQTILARAPKVDRVTKANCPGQTNYIIPRGRDQVILGGCFEVGSTDLSVHPNTGQQILKACYALDPRLSDSGLDGIEILSHNVGLRPAREGGARVEKELINVKGKEVSVVHAYGVSSYGYQVSWAIAEDVLKML